MINIPNAITLLRILMVPLFLSFLAEGSTDLALAVFILAGVSDAIDGAIARITDTRTELGAHMDPAADKLLLVSAFIALGIKEMVPLRLMILVIVRDVVILGAYLISAAMAGKSMPMQPTVWGKLSTFLQLSCVGLVLLAHTAWVGIPSLVLSTVFIATGITAVISGAGYMLDGLRWYQGLETDGPPATS